MKNPATIYPNTNGCFSHLNTTVITPAVIRIMAKSKKIGGNDDINALYDRLLYFSFLFPFFGCSNFCESTQRLCQSSHFIIVSSLSMAPPAVADLPINAIPFALLPQIAPCFTFFSALVLIGSYCSHSRHCHCHIFCAFALKKASLFLFCQ